MNTINRDIHDLLSEAEDHLPEAEAVAALALLSGCVSYLRNGIYFITEDECTTVARHATAFTEATKIFNQLQDTHNAFLNILKLRVANLKCPTSVTNQLIDCIREVETAQSSAGGRARDSI